MNRKKILHITSGHTGFDERIFHKEVLSLAKSYDITVLSPGVNGKVIKNNGELITEGTYHNVEQYAFAKISDVTGKQKLFWKVLRIIKVKDRLLSKWAYDKIKNNNIKADVVHIHEPDLFSLAIRLKNEWNCKIVFDCHEFYYLYPLNWHRYPRSHWQVYGELLRFKKRLPKFDAIVSVNRTMKNINSLFASETNHEVIYNNTILKFPEKNERNDKTILVHDGLLPFNRGFKLMCDIFLDCWIKENVRLLIVGEIKGAEKTYFDNRCIKEPWLKECIQDTGWLDLKYVPENLLKGDIGIIFFESNYNNMLGMPNKFFNYGAACLPILSTKLPELMDIVEGNRIGKCVDRNVESIKDGIKTIIDNKEVFKNNLKSCKSLFEWKSEEKKLLSLYERIL